MSYQININNFKILEQNANNSNNCNNCNYSNCDTKLVIKRRSESLQFKNIFLFVIKSQFTLHKTFNVLNLILLYPRYNQWNEILYCNADYTEN